ncbi:MAG: aryl-sulfate sulfotransferase [Alphaproteobacteria bacterium]|nr:aryl-sulfate sulfotransferase [Alphaproteobacteria bacterium]
MSVVSLVLVGCALGGSGGSGTVGDATSSGTVTSAACATTDNALRFSCWLALDEADEVTWSVYEGDALVRTWVTQTSSTPVGELWGLAPETTYRWEAVAAGGSASGEVTTGSLPSDFDGMSLGTSGDAPGADAFLTNLSCGGFTGLVMVDAAGRVVWYQDVDSDGGTGSLAGVTGFDRDADGTLLTAVDGERLVQWSPMGDVLAEATGFDHPLHHDVAIEDGRVWALFAEEMDGRVIDGFVVVDGSTQVASWSLADQVTVSGTTNSQDGFWGQVFPGASDWAHANSIEVRDGVALVSFRWLDAVMGIPVDPEDGDFGEPLFTLVGQSGGALAGDVVFADGGGFDGQHHASWSSDGHLALFDNGTSNSRGLHVDVDLDAGTATEAASFGMGRTCQIQGSVYDLPGGDVLVTCADAGEASAWPADGGSSSWSMSLTCGGSRSGGSTTTRVMPITW